MKAIKPSLGNWFMDDIPVQITSIKEATPFYLGITHTPNSIGVTHGNNIDPIPLTEQWLKDLGFKNGTIVIQDKSICTSERIFNYLGMGAISTAFYINSAFIANIKYVHKLQNLYYELSGGTELIYENNKDNDK